MDLVTSSAELAAVCERLARHPFVTVDTEFLRETTFWPKLCVVQMAGPDEAAIIDALAPDFDLSPFFQLMADERVVKVFHAARQDVEIAWNLAKLIPKPMFDTQVAAMVLGYGDSISYDQLVQRITGGAIDKSSRFTDWSRRPLSPAQVAYAISDVTHLRDIYLKLKADLETKNRLDWVEDEMKILTSPETYKQEPHNAWQRLKTRVRTAVFHIGFVAAEAGQYERSVFHRRHRRKDRRQLEGLIAERGYYLEAPAWQPESGPA